MIDLDKLQADAEAQLVQCGSCDFGLVEYGCNCPKGDPRSVISDVLPLIAEVRELRTQRDTVLALATEGHDATNGYCRWALKQIADILSEDASASDPDGLSSPSHPVPGSPTRLGAGTAEVEASTEVSGAPLGWIDAEGCTAHDHGVHRVGLRGRCVCGWAP